MNEQGALCRSDLKNKVEEKRAPKDSESHIEDSFEAIQNRADTRLDKEAKKAINLRKRSQREKHSENLANKPTWFEHAYLSYLPSVTLEYCRSLVLDKKLSENAQKDEAKHLKEIEKRNTEKDVPAKTLKRKPSDATKHFRECVEKIRSLENKLRLKAHVFFTKFFNEYPPEKCATPDKMLQSLKEFGEASYPQKMKSTKKSVWANLSETDLLTSVLNKALLEAQSDEVSHLIPLKLF